MLAAHKLKAKSNKIEVNMDCEKYRKKTKKFLVRFTEEESKKIKSHSKASGKSVDSLLRDSYFRRTMNLKIVQRDELDGIRYSLGKIGNNLNQISRSLNSGGGCELKDLVQALAEINVMREMINGKLCP